MAHQAATQTDRVSRTANAPLITLQESPYPYRSFEGRTAALPFVIYNDIDNARFPDIEPHAFAAGLAMITYNMVIMEPGLPLVAFTLEHDDLLRLDKEFCTLAGKSPVVETARALINVDPHTDYDLGMFENCNVGTGNWGIAGRRDGRWSRFAVVSQKQPKSEELGPFNKAWGVAESAEFYNLKTFLPTAYVRSNSVHRFVLTTDSDEFPNRCSPHDLQLLENLVMESAAMPELDYLHFCISPFYMRHHIFICKYVWNSYRRAVKSLRRT